MIYHTYKEPASWFSTNLKGYLGGGFMIILSVISIAGKFSLLDTYIGLIRKLFHLKANQSGIVIAVFISIIFLVFGLTYYRPDKIQAKYQNISEDNNYAKTKLVSGCLLFYFAFTIIIAYLIVWLLRR